MSEESKKRMGVDGNGYGALVDAIFSRISKDHEAQCVLSAEDWLRLAWACVDQASSMRTVRLAQRALEAIEDMYDAEPETVREGTAPDPVKLVEAKKAGAT